jgi:hypothetical protein
VYFGVWKCRCRRRCRCTSTPTPTPSILGVNVPDYILLEIKSRHKQTESRINIYLKKRKNGA